MSGIDKTLLDSNGWRMCCSVYGDRLNGHGQITLYSDSSCTLSVADTITRMMPHVQRYCQLRFSEELPDEPCLYMFVSYNHRCLVQIEEYDLYNSLHAGVVKIVTDGSEESIPFIDMDTACALERGEKVYLCYWPLYSNINKTLLYLKQKFLTDFSDPVWKDSRDYSI